jgi:hypothetical protein
VVGPGEWAGTDFEIRSFANFGSDSESLPVASKIMSAYPVPGFEPRSSQLPLIMLNKDQTTAVLVPQHPKTLRERVKPVLFPFSD